LMGGGYHVVGLGSYFSGGEEEVGGWTLKKGMKGGECAGIMDRDFEKGFMRGERVWYDDLVDGG
ncbi:DUF933 domain-containing protein, partial [Siminovitchia fortis]|uniref:DUF933 domain-containing protein n=1 Tax=Siminovitchia fortis TaxID=254758 RepID=UPI0011A2C842